MKIRKGLVITALTLLIMVLLLGGMGWAATHNVTDATGLQNALDLAKGNGESDTIRIAQGIYSGNFTYDPIAGENFDLTIEGGWNTGFTARTLDPLNTTLNGNNAGRVLNLIASNGTTGNIKVEGLNVINGRVVGGAGGGLITQTYSPGGVTVNKNIFNNNFAETIGGGLGIVSGYSNTLSNNIIKNNTSGPYLGTNINLPFAGGAYLYCSANCLIFNNLIYNNVTDDSNHPEGGGKAGGVMVQGSGEIYIVNNTITQNTGYFYGGGMYLVGGPTVSHYYFYNNIIRGNNCTACFYGDEDIFNDIRSTIPGNSVTIAHSNYQYLGGLGDAPVTYLNNIDLPPEFVGGVNFHLENDSPCIDSGVNSISGFTLPPADLDGRKRIVDGKSGRGLVVDMGAYEYDPYPNKLDLPLILKN